MGRVRLGNEDEWVVDCGVAWGGWFKGLVGEEVCGGCGGWLFFFLFLLAFCAFALCDLGGIVG